MRGSIVGLLTLLASPLVCNANEDSLAALARDVKAVCTQPETQGQHWAISGDVKGSAGIQLKLLKLAGIAGTLHFTKEEWTGIQRVLATQQAVDNKDYRDCVRKLTPKFLAKMSGSAAPHRAGDVSISGNIAAGTGGTHGKGGDARIEAGTGYNRASGGNVTVGPGNYRGGDAGAGGDGGNLVIKAGDAK